jgi:hypothetical protein
MARCGGSTTSILVNIPEVIDCYLCDGYKMSRQGAGSLGDFGWFFHCRTLGSGGLDVLLPGWACCVKIGPRNIFQPCVRWPADGIYGVVLKAFISPSGLSWLY